MLMLLMVTTFLTWCTIIVLLLNSIHYEFDPPNYLDHHNHGELATLQRYHLIRAPLRFDDVAHTTNESDFKLFFKSEII